MPERKASITTDSATTDTSTIRIAGLLVREDFTPRLLKVLEDLRDAGMKFIYRNEISIQPDDRILFMVSDRPFDDEQQQLEANAILADLLNFESPEPARFMTEGVHGVYEVVCFERV
jgi:hypothetical protein